MKKKNNNTITKEQAQKIIFEKMQAINPDLKMEDIKVNIKNTDEYTEVEATIGKDKLIRKSAKDLNKLASADIVEQIKNESDINVAAALVTLCHAASILMKHNEIETFASHGVTISKFD